MTTPALRAVGAMKSYGGNNDTLSKPTGTAAGDVMLAFLEADGPNTAASWASRLPAGWTLLHEDTVSTSGFIGYPAVAIKVAGAAEPATYAFSFGSQIGAGVIVSYSGVDTTTPVDASAQQINGTAGTSMGIPSVTTTRTDSLLVAAYFNRQTNGVTHTPPAGMTQRISQKGAYSLSNFGIADVGIPAAGATGARTATSATADVSFGVAIALRSVDGVAGGGGGTAPTITTQPQAQSVTSGSTATFGVVAAGTAPLTYQWLRNGTAISGATSASYTTSALTTADTGTTFSVTVTNASGSVTSSVATLTVSASATAPSITTQPTAQTVTVGTPVTLTVVASGTAPLTYQWRKGGVAISGATAATYTISAAASGDAGSYDVVVTNSAGSATSTAAVLTVNAAVAGTAPIPILVGIDPLTGKLIHIL